MRNLLEDDRKYILNVYRRMDLEIVKGEGSYLFDSKGIKYLDMFSGIAVNSLGVSNKEINKIITKQIENYIHLSNYFVSEPTVNLAKLLVDNSFASKVFFSNSGTEANEAAFKLARKYGKGININKTEVLSSYNSFHGRTMGGLTLTGQDKYKAVYHPLVPNVSHFNFNDIKSLREKINDNTCAVFIEIIQGEGGVKEVSEEFINELVKLSNEYKFLIIIDEVQTGIGRTGDLFAYEKFDFKPHIITLAKSLGGGIPIGAMLVSEELENILKPGDHGSTFGGNPLASAVGEYIVETISKESFKNEIKNKGNFIINKLYRIKENYPNIINEIRGRGLMIGIEVGQYANEIKKIGLEKNLLLNVTNDTVVRLLPPLSISNEEINVFLNKFEEILSSL